MGLSLAILVLATALAACAFVWIVRRELLRRDILDRPNERSSHDIPTPRGGGIGLLAALLPAWLIAVFVVLPPTAAPQSWLLPVCAVVLAGVSWIDDLRTIGPLPRLAAQFAAAIAGVLVLPGLVFQGLVPPWLDAALAAIGLVWFVNLFNFMDGIDGISAVEAIAIGLGLGIIGLWPGATADATPVLPFLIAAASAGFLVWNWHPAKIFLGDIGSVPLGFLLGWLLLALAASGAWEAALILPLYYLADATITLLRRLARGEKVWRAHREHFYQQAVRKGLSHAKVSGAVAAVNMALVALSLIAVAMPDSAAARLAALAVAAGVVLALLAWMRRPA